MTAEKRAMDQAQEDALKARIVLVLGTTLSGWKVREGAVRFRTAMPITFKLLEALSVELGTDTINFDFGESGERGYSDVTPGSPGMPGYIEVILWKREGQ